ncbi:Hypothetical protein MALK_5260 [Metamycoplasma alkalescens 14918]|uniref:Uncharacterized protein n=1 Tax=Metamycoplasma alkalescens 14918 TaxID=1188234 RepID=N9SQT8_9BACT|nr:Hypothetical protein MALK_5260 [Metamycoplasma alkalescens 14918]
MIYKCYHNIFRIIFIYKFDRFSQNFKRLKIIFSNQNVVKLFSKNLVKYYKYNIFCIFNIIIICYKNIAIKIRCKKS